jgi:hypothetical protein
MKYDIDFKKGEEYIIDGQSKVTLIHFWPTTMIFCKVRNEDTGYEWETMLGRLTEIK